jgi:hypothetical protein
VPQYAYAVSFLIIGIWWINHHARMGVIDLCGDEWDGGEERKGWRMNEASVRERLCGELIGGSSYELEPEIHCGRTTPIMRTRSLGYWDGED